MARGIPKVVAVAGVDRITRLLDVERSRGAVFGEDETLLADLLSDLAHWSESRGIDFTGALRQAQELFEAEGGNIY